MKELYFKVTIAENIDNPLTIEETRQNPTFKLYLAEYHEKLINVMYEPANGLDENQFIQLMSRKLKRKFRTSIVEHLEMQTKLI